MGIATFPAGSSGLSSVVRSVQRGVAASAGNITITSVDTTKTIVNSFSTSSAGSVAATGTVSAANGTASAFSSSATSGSIFIGSNPNQTPTTRTGGNYSYNPRYGGTAGPFAGVSFNQSAMNMNAQNIGLNATNISGGSTSLTSAVYGAYLINSTTITVTGPCRYEVIEYF
jgi:hypothetical protein